MDGIGSDVSLLSASDVAVDEENCRLVIGSMIAAELRQAIFNTLGLTGCAGIANNKLLAKLVSGTFKPNQQTTLLPYSTAELMSSLTGLRRVPGKMFCYLCLSVQEI